jgi:hypothetical protein
MALINILKKFLPERSKKKLIKLKRKNIKFQEKLFNLFRDEFNNNYNRNKKTIPKYQLKKENFKNLKSTLNREHLLRLLPKNGIVAEIGVYKGDFSKKILDIAAPKKLYLIDKWGSKRYSKGFQKLVERRFKDEIKNHKIEIKVGLSVEIADTFQNNYFDWVYIDTAHNYNTTKSELEKYSKKVKYNGIIAGHDFIIGNWSRMKRYGVIEAVYEFCVKNSWELIYITMDCLYEFPSFAIRRIID